MHWAVMFPNPNRPHEATEQTRHSNPNRPHEATEQHAILIPTGLTKQQSKHLTLNRNART
jgi:hypothetical protein